MLVSLGDWSEDVIKCLLPIPIESYGSWCVGLWIEISQPDFTRAHQVWEDRARYPSLRFSGRLANDAAKVLELPIRLGADVELQVPDP